MTRWVFAKTSVWPNRYVLLHKYILQRPKLFKLKDFVETLHHYTVFQKLVLLVFNPLKLTFCSIYIVVFPSAWRFFGIGSFCNFWYVLETHITLCVTEPDFWKKLFWFFICWYKYRKAKSYFNFWMDVIRNGRDFWGYGTVKSAVLVLLAIFDFSILGIHFQRVSQFAVASPPVETSCVNGSFLSAFWLVKRSFIL